MGIVLFVSKDRNENQEEQRNGIIESELLTKENKLLLIYGKKRLALLVISINITFHVITGCVNGKRKMGSKKENTGTYRIISQKKGGETLKKVLLATGLSQIEQQMESKNWNRCYQRQILIEVAKEYGSKDIVLSPHLPGDEDLLKEIIAPLRTEGVRIIFLPGDAKMSDAKEWMKQLIPWGVYDYVFDPVTAEKIIDRVNNPAQLKDLPSELKQISPKEAQDVISIIPDEPEPKKSFKESLLQNASGLMSKLTQTISKDTKHVKSPNPQEDQNTEPPKPQEDQNTDTRVKEKAKSIKQWFVKSGVIQNGQYIKYSWKNISEALLDYCPDNDGIIIPASWGIDAIREYQKESCSKTIPLVVIGGNKEHLAAGADRVVKKITPDVIQDLTSLSRRLKELWESVETEELTKVYTRKFLFSWMDEREQRGNPYSAVILDLDKFKNVNDTYGHLAGDAVLSAFGGFLKSQSRSKDFVARYGGEEFFIGLPNASAKEAQVLIDRLREKWSERIINLPDGRTIKTTFSAGVAEWTPGCNVLEEADKMLYEAKETGRNKVVAQIKTKILLLGIQKNSINRPVDITYDPSEASIVISDISSVRYAPKQIPLYVLGTRSIQDFLVTQERPDAILCSNINEILDRIIPSKPNLAVLPGARSTGKNQTIPNHGALYIVCPSRPAMAGEISARLSQLTSNAALVCATPESTAAVTLGVPNEKLIVSDWRIPGADAPIKWTDVMIWPIDPYKFININADIHGLVDQIKHCFSLTIIDCGGSLDICSRSAKDEGVLLLTKEGDASDQAAHQWFKTYGGHNVMVMSPAEVPGLIAAENGFVITA